MLGRAALVTTALAFAACAGRPAALRVPSSSDPERAGVPAAPSVRWFQAVPDESFWVTHAVDRDRIVAGGARLELAPSGEITAAAWDTELTARGDALVGALEVPARLGGGFVCWSRLRVFRAREFTGPLEPIALGGDLGILGARVGLASIVVFTDAGPRELAPGSARLRAAGDPGLFDAAAISASRAARLDLFGRLLVTDDGGASYRDLSPRTGMGVRQLVVGEGDLSIESWLGRYVVGPGGALEPGENRSRGRRDAMRAFQVAWKGSLSSDAEDSTYGPLDATPLAISVASGAAVGDGTAFGVARGAILRVDLATGKLLRASTDVLAGALTCQPLHAPDSVLFACSWERGSGFGGYVLRSIGGAPPVVEKAFSDDGSFVASDDGAIGYIGSCRAEARYFDADDLGRTDLSTEAPLRPVLCVRRGPGEWVERHVDAGEGSMLVAWIPRLDGTAAAIALSTQPLPPPRGTSRVVEPSGVRLVRVYREIAGWVLKRAEFQSERPAGGGYVDRRFRVLADGSIDGWLAPGPANDSTPAVTVAVTFDPTGVPVLHPPAPGSIEAVVGGSFGVAFTRDGDLYETVDHGHTWRAAGRSPAPPNPYAALGCTALGCAFGPIARVGWGDASVVPRIASDPLPDPEAPPPLPRLACSPRGAPVPLVVPAEPEGSKTVIPTSWGDSLELIHDGPALEPPAPPPFVGPPLLAPPTPASPAPPPPAPAPPATRMKARPSPAVLRTHSLFVRTPFAPQASPRRLNGTDASWSTQRQRPTVVPLLTASGDVDLFVSGSENELLIAGDKISVMPSFEGRRSYMTDHSGWSGLVLGDGRALLFGETRRRLTLEDHGARPAPPPLFLGPEHDPLRKRSVAIARRDDGSLGVLVLDGSAPETAGVAKLDRVAASVSTTTRLAPWSTVIAGDDPRCKKGADPDAYRAIIAVDPAAWLSLDPARLPGFALLHAGIALVRWGKDRVCLEALDASATDLRRRDDSKRSVHLVIRWAGEKDRGAAIRSADLRQDLTCTLEPPPR